MKKQILLSKWGSYKSTLYWLLPKGEYMAITNVRKMGPNMEVALEDGRRFIADKARLVYPAAVVREAQRTSKRKAKGGIA